MKTQSSKVKAQSHNLKLKTFALCALVLHFALCTLHFCSPTHAITNPISYKITVSATIGEPRLTLFGYTSPFATVSLQGGTSLFAQTIANSGGHFIFEKLFVLEKVGDYCLYAEDRKERTTSPVCLPPLPQGSYSLTIGPVLLSPTLSLTKGRFLPGEHVEASGETIPNTKIKVSLFNQKRIPLFVRYVYAYSLPEYLIESDRNGNFSFNLPSFSPNTYRLFANSFWERMGSPKSTTLTFKVLTIWEWLLEKIKTILKLILGLFQPPNLTLIIFGETLVILLLLKRRYYQMRLNPARGATKRG